MAKRSNSNPTKAKAGKTPDPFDEDDKGLDVEEQSSDEEEEEFVGEDGEQLLPESGEESDEEGDESPADDEGGDDQSEDDDEDDFGDVENMDEKDLLEAIRKLAAQGVEDIDSEDVDDSEDDEEEEEQEEGEDDDEEDGGVGAEVAAERKFSESIAADPGSDSSEDERPSRNTGMWACASLSYVRRSTVTKWGISLPAPNPSNLRFLVCLIDARTTIAEAGKCAAEM
eukprot:2037993-Pyramimonas_sp.AAC.1